MTGSHEGGGGGAHAPGRWLEPGAALVVVDVQNDFCPGGALAVPDGDRVVPVLNRCAGKYRTAGLPVVFTRDWHPPGHLSFREQGGPWPVHCLQDSPGAAFHPDLDVAKGDTIVSKPTAADHDVFNGFEGTGLAETLRRKGVERVLVGGLATEYCVRATVLGALREGFEAAVLLDGVAGIDVNAGDVEKALREMQAAGAEVVRALC